MNTKRQVKWMSGAMLSMLVTLTVTLSATFSTPLQAETQNKKPILLAGPIGKSSSASARVTLIIPPRADKTKKATVQKAQQPVDNKK